MTSLTTACLHFFLFHAFNLIVYYCVVVFLAVCCLPFRRGLTFCHLFTTHTSCLVYQVCLLFLVVLFWKTKSSMAWQAFWTLGLDGCSPSSPSSHSLPPGIFPSSPPAMTDTILSFIISLHFSLVSCLLPDDERDRDIQHLPFLYYSFLFALPRLG